jgi:hypothetical protein
MANESKLHNIPHISAPRERENEGRKLQRIPMYEHKQHDCMFCDGTQTYPPHLVFLRLFEKGDTKDGALSSRKLLAYTASNTFTLLDLLRILAMGPVSRSHGGLHTLLVLPQTGMTDGSLRVRLRSVTCATEARSGTTLHYRQARLSDYLRRIARTPSLLCFADWAILFFFVQEQLRGNGCSSAELLQNGIFFSSLILARKWS